MLIVISVLIICKNLQLLLFKIVALQGESWVPPACLLHFLCLSLAFSLRIEYNIVYILNILYKLNYELK